MTLSSMTGFARTGGQDGACSWTWEVKSVNAKGLDVRCRLPGGFERLEPLARERVKKMFRRGNLTLMLNVTWDKGGAGFRVNQAVLEELLAILPEIQKQIPGAGAPSADGLLGLRGVIEPIEEDLSDEAREAMETSILADLDSALEGLAEMRRDEGSRLVSAMESHLDDIGRLCGKAEELAAAQPDAIRERLQTQVQALLEDVSSIPEERLVQEAALLMSKADLREELDRLKAHQEAARELVASDNAVGRKLDFLCQEFNREANTLCSKSQDIELTRVGLELKAAIEQLREQVQNIE